MEFKNGDEVIYKGGGGFLDLYLTKGNVYTVEEYFRSPGGYASFQVKDDHVLSGKSDTTLAIEVDEFIYFKLAK